MLRRFVCAGFVLLAVGGIVLADTIFGRITDIKDNKMTVVAFSKEKKGKGEEKTITVSKDTKVFKQKGKDGEPESATLSDLKEVVKKGGKGKFKGAFAKIEAEDGKASKITYFYGFGFGKKKKKEKE
jgi:hypothetical protein